MATAIAAAFILSVFTLGVFTSAEARDREPVPPSIEAEYFVKAIRLKDRLLEDYKKVLTAYYELKKKSATPDVFPNPMYSLEMAGNMSLPEDLRTRLSQPTTKSFFEFSHAAYEEFKEELERDPKLRGNTYIRRMKEYGGGQANDVFQRIGTYAQEPFENLRKGMQLMLYMETGSPITALGMVESHEVFLEVSKKAGYPQNGNPAALPKKLEWTEVVDKKAIQLEAEIRELGYDLRGRKLSAASTKKPRAAKGGPNSGGGAGSCATAFRSIAD